MRAAIYARVSSAAQRDSHTIENQLRTLPAFVKSQGWTLAGTYTDDGRSAKAGKLDAREGFARLVRDADAKVFDVVVVVDIDRLTRTDDLEERARILGPFQRNGIQIVTPHGGALDLRTMLGELYVTMQALVAAEENRKRADRIRAGKLRAIAEGRKPAGPTPYGLAYDRTSGAWSINSETAPILREIFRRVIAGEACQSIADDFHERGIRPPRGSWDRERVYKLVRSEHSFGRWVADKAKGLAIDVPSIINVKTFRAAQSKLMEHNRRGLRRTRYVYLLEGLAVCGLCGATMHIRSATHVPRRGFTNCAAYVCSARKVPMRRKARCKAPIVPVADVDARVWATVEAALVGRDLVAKIERKLDARDANRRHWKDDAERYRARLAKLAKAETGILARYRAGSISDAALDHELAAIGKERKTLTAQLDAAEAASARKGPQVSARDIAAELRALAASSTPEARQRVVRWIVEPGAVFHGERVELTLGIEEPRKAANQSPSLVRLSGYRTSHEAIVRLRLVA